MIQLDFILSARLVKRKLLDEVKKYVYAPEALVITGPRQSGKTSLLFLLVQDLVKSGQGKVFFYDLESPEDMELLRNLDFPQTLPDGSYLFVDEIQYHPQPDKFIKLTVDHLKGRVKLIVSGSSSFSLKKKFKEALVGRKFEFVLLPLNFEEFLIFKGREDLAQGIMSVPHEAISSYFEEFVLFGGYPRVVLEKEVEIKKKILSEIFTSYIHRDIVPLFALKSPDKFATFLRYLSTIMGGILNISTISRELGMSKSTVYSYLKALEITYLIHLLRPFSTNPKKEITRQPKVYFVDTGFRNWIIRAFNVLSLRTDKGELVENCIFMEIVKSLPIDVPIGYWRDKAGNEVDFIINRHYPLEVKYSKFAYPLPRGFRTFISLYKPSKGFLIFREGEGKIKLRETYIDYFPPWKVTGNLQKTFV